MAPALNFCIRLAATLALVVSYSTAARAGQCGPTCSTVCVGGGCDFTSPQACITPSVSGAVCLTRGGTYLETVDSHATCPGNCPENVELRCEDPVNNPCVIDGEGIRQNGFVGYRGWVLDGFEVRNTLADAVTSISSRYLGAVRNCFVHDVGGDGIKYVDISTTDVVAYIENNRIEFTGSDGILCPSSGDDIVVRNNILLNVAIDSGSGINCNKDTSVVEHNTVVIADTSAPYSAAPYGIVGRVVRYNIVVGGNTGIWTNGVGAETAYNITSGWVSAAIGGSGTSTGDLTDDPHLMGYRDFYLQEGSPAINGALGSTLTTDFTGATRIDEADIGALEYAAAHEFDASPWPIRETVSSTPEKAAAPAMVFIPGQGPAVLYFDNPSGSSDLVFSQRLQDGTWSTSIVQANAQIQNQTSTNTSEQATDITLNPSTNLPAAVWVEQSGNQQRLLFARYHGDECAGGDCSSSTWSGCSSPVATYTNATLSVALAFHPTLHFPAIALSREDASGQFTLEYWDLSTGVWSQLVVEQGLTINYLGRGIDISFHPVSGQAELAYTRIATTGDSGELVLASGDLGGMTLLQLPLGSNHPAVDGTYSQVALAHWDNGDLAAVYSARNSAGSYTAMAFMERRSGSWNTPAVPTMTWSNAALNRFHGVDLLINGAGDPVVASSHHHLVRVSRRNGPLWLPRGVDVRQDTGDWIQGSFGDSGDLMLAYQRSTVDRSIHFCAESDPGGADVSILPGACDDNNLCTSSACLLGSCVHTPVDCNDNNACTDDSCLPGDGSCLNQPTSCSDGDLCTADSCDPQTGCSNPPLVCDDNNLCTTDTCNPSDGTCDHAADLCADGDLCTTDSCDPSTGACSFPPVVCDDGDLCTVDSCQASDGSCQYVELVCDDGNSCTDDSCVGALGCQYTDNTLPCDDGDSTTIGDICLAGTCSGLPAVITLPTIAETVTLGDTYQITPPLNIVVSETITVDDTNGGTGPRVILPVTIVVSETVTIDDSPQITRAPAADAGLRDRSLSDTTSSDRTGASRDRNKGRDPPEKGCGDCSSLGTPPFWLWGFVVAVLLWRRKR